MDTPGAESPSPRQTLSYLRNLFDERGIKPKNKLGQNFLIDLNVLDVMVAAAELSKDDLVVEVGSGTGSLTTAPGRVIGLNRSIVANARSSQAMASRETSCR